MKYNKDRMCTWELESLRVSSVVGTACWRIPTRRWVMVDADGWWRRRWRVTWWRRWAGVWCHCSMLGELCQAAATLPVKCCNNSDFNYLLPVWHSWWLGTDAKSRIWVHCHTGAVKDTKEEEDQRMSGKKRSGKDRSGRLMWDDWTLCWQEVRK